MCLCNLFPLQHGEDGGNYQHSEAPPCTSISRGWQSSYVSTCVWMSCWTTIASRLGCRYPFLTASGCTDREKRKKKNAASHVCASAMSSFLYYFPCSLSFPINLFMCVLCVFLCVRTHARTLLRWYPLSHCHTCIFATSVYPFHCVVSWEKDCLKLHKQK